jgi:hypothetical protein
MPNSEKSETVKILESNGEKITGISCAIAVPDINVSTFLWNSDLFSI